MSSENADSNECLIFENMMFKKGCTLEMKLCVMGGVHATSCYLELDYMIHCKIMLRKTCISHF